MKRFLPVIIVLAVVVIGVGFARGWFAFSSPAPDKGSDKVNFNLTMDKGKMQDDARAVKDQAQAFGKVSE